MKSLFRFWPVFTFSVPFHLIWTTVRDRKTRPEMILCQVSYINLPHSFWITHGLSFPVDICFWILFVSIFSAVFRDSLQLATSLIKKTTLTWYYFFPTDFYFLILLRFLLQNDNSRLFFFFLEGCNQLILNSFNLL